MKTTKKLPDAELEIMLVVWGRQKSAGDLRLYYGAVGQGLDQTYAAQFADAAVR